MSIGFSNVEVEENQNTSPYNVPLWQKDYFELKATDKQTQEKLHALPLFV